MSLQRQPELGPNLHIRLAVAADTASIVSITNAAFAVDTFLEGTRTDETRLAEMMQEGSFLVAVDGVGQILASVYIALRGARGYFGMLAVDPAQQGKGLGRLMAEAAENHCRMRGCNAMDIAVLSLRPELPPYYRKLGYVETGTEEFHPSRPLKASVECHCIVMSKAL